MTLLRGRSGRSRDRGGLREIRNAPQSQHKTSAYSILSKNQLFSAFDHYLATIKDVTSWLRDGLSFSASPSYINDQQRTCPSVTQPFPTFRSNQNHSIKKPSRYHLKINPGNCCTRCVTRPVIIKFGRSSNVAGRVKDSSTTLILNPSQALRGGGRPPILCARLR
jgi:hypothetical protein